MKQSDIRPRLYDNPDEDYVYFDSSSAEPETVYEINRELNLARRIVEETGANLFLTGKAGTGKTTFLRHLREESAKRMVVLAPTGVAAINAGGSTIHSFFQLSFSPFIPGKGFMEKDGRRFNFSKEKRRIISSLDLLVIDEISMVRPDLLDAVDDVLRRYRNPARPFGGVQLLLIGDLRQLAPVVREEEWQYLRPYYDSEYFFESKALKESGFLTIELTTVYRQSDNDFIGMLNAVREGKVDDDTLARLNSRYIPGFLPSEDEKYIRLTTHNRMADDINFRRLALIPAPESRFEAVVTGKFPDASFPADKVLALKKGAQVMFIKNDSGTDRKYYNGMLAEVTDIDEEMIYVRPADSSEIIAVERAEWENSQYVIDPSTQEITQVVEGTFTQYPLRLAWAITIHKSQGLTFDRAIIDAGSSFAPGQTYVALSRCRSLQGLVLGQIIGRSAVITDAKVNSFVDACSSHRPDKDTLDRMRCEYTRMILSELFDFRAIKVAFDDFHRCISEYVVPVYPEYYQPFREASEKMAHKIDAVGAKFGALYASAPVKPENLEVHRAFLDKIKGGCRYFIDVMKEVLDVVEHVNVKVDNSTYVSRLDNAYESVDFLMRVKLRVLSSLLDRDFSPSLYVRLKAHAVLEEQAAPQVKKNKGAVKTKTKTNTKEKKEKKEKRPIGYSKHESFKMYLNGMDIPQIAEERNLALSTIAGHLAEFVISGQLRLTDVVDSESVILLEESFGKEMSISQVREELEGKVRDYEIALYYKAIVKPNS